MTDAEILELAARFFDAVQTGDIDAARAIYADDAVIWHNDDRREQPAAENLQVLAWMARNIPERAYTEVRRDVVPGGFVQQHVLRGTTRWGARVELPAMVRVWCEDGRITRLDEYYDSAHTAVLRR
jgi:ketosteroid isomerase-like protein